MSELRGKRIGRSVVEGSFFFSLLVKRLFFTCLKIVEMGKNWLFLEF